MQDAQLYMRWGSYPFPRILTPTAKDGFVTNTPGYAFERDQGKIARMVCQWPEGKPITFQPEKPDGTMNDGGL